MQGMLEAHNQTRAAVGVAPLVWSSQMSQYAQQWAEHLSTQNNCQMQHRSAAGANTLPVGENIYWASPVRWSDGRTEVQTIAPSQVALDWASEKADYSYASNTCRSGAQCGHYTQMVWRTTAEVGCGMSICPDKGQIWVCNYNPPGNWVGEKPY
jgi:pathogenesis-related protein 1